jgi:hypothetical protein
MLNEKLKDIIEEVLRKYVKEYQNPEVENDKNIARIIYAAIRESRLVYNSPKSLEEQEFNIYKWTAIENDGYTRMESGVANNMFEAFVKATEYSPSYHKYIEIKKVEKENYTDADKELLEWYEGAKCDE